MEVRNAVDVGRREVVDGTGHPRAGLAGEGPRLELGEARVVLDEHLHEQVLVEVLGVECGERLAAALLPVADQAHVGLHADGHAALEQRDPQVGEPLGDAAEEQRLRQRVARRGEVADLVEVEVGDRRAVARPHSRGVRGQRDLQLDGLRPHRVVVVGAVDPEGVDPALGLPLGDPDARPLVVGWPRVTDVGPVHVAGDHADLGAHALRVLERGDRLVGRVHRDDRGAGEAIAESLVHLGRPLVVEAAHRDPLLLPVDLRERDPRGRVQHHEVDAGLVEPLVVALRRRDRRVVLGGRGRVPRVRTDASGAPFVERDVLDGPTLAEHALEQIGVAALGHVVEEHRHDLDDVTVAVEHRVSELRPQIRRRLRPVRHDRPLLVSVDSSSGPSADRPDPSGPNSCSRGTYTTRGRSCTPASSISRASAWAPPTPAARTMFSGVHNASYTHRT